jgi:DNA-binding NtrC family response regulator
MMTRRELLIGSAAAIVTSTVGRPAWSATAPAASVAAAPSPLDAIIGESPAIVALRDSIRALLDRAVGARRPPPVFLLGKNGVGKDLTALHELIAPLDPVILTAPPLRQRGDDVQLLADHFLARHGRALDQPTKVLTPGARRALGANPWPGNVRQLANVIERAVILSERREIDAEEVAV